MVCHYTSKDKAISILNNKKLNFSSLASCDDPRESKKWNFDFIGSGQRFCLENYGEALGNFDKSLKNNSMILCFCGWNDERMNFEEDHIAMAYSALSNLISCHEITTTPERRLVMTKEDCDTASQGR